MAEEKLWKVGRGWVHSAAVRMFLPLYFLWSGANMFAAPCQGSLNLRAYLPEEIRQAKSPRLYLAGARKWQWERKE